MGNKGSCRQSFLLQEKSIAGVTRPAAIKKALERKLRKQLNKKRRAQAASAAAVESEE